MLSRIHLNLYGSVNISKWNWAMIGGIGTIVAILIAVLIAMLQRKRKILHYSVSRSRIATTDRTNAGRMKILFDNKPVESVEYVVIGFANRGNVGIPPSDYVEPITVRFDEGVEVLDAQFGMDGEPFAPIHASGRSVDLPKILLNKNEKCGVVMVVAPVSAQPPQVRGRIVDTQIQEASGDTYSGRTDTLFGFATMLTTVATVILSGSLHELPEPMATLTLSFLVGAMFVFALGRLFRRS